MPQYAKNAIFVSRYKNKGIISDYGNYRGICLIGVQDYLPQARCGVRPRLRYDICNLTLARKRREKNMDYVVFTDLTIASLVYTNWPCLVKGRTNSLVKGRTNSSVKRLCTFR